MSPPHKDENGNGEKKLVNGKVYTGIWAIFQMLGNFAGLASLLAVALFGGEIKRQVEINTKRLDTIENSGSPTLRETVKALSLEVEFRKEADATTGKRVDDMRADFNQRIVNITSLLERLVDQQTQLLALIKAQQQIK